MQTRYAWLVLAVAFALSTNALESKWKSMQMEELEKKYESGDERDELESEEDRMQSVVRKKGAEYLDPTKATKAHPEMFGGGVGASMIFVSLNKENEATGKLRTSTDFAAIAGKFDQLMKTGGLVVDVRNTDINMVMFNLQRGWLTQEVERFLSMQKEVLHWTNDGNKFTPKEYREQHRDEDEDEDDDDL
ncbi:hypothetical protein B484DRAFT_404553 [Ochromonadaceae sp. CCMP2298]|nr:hypothetical protein B484DRAFT_404553 [Ochromonadaceae sp. CCMP2298]|mmetsp:Transcript_15463/g.34119  ORF Transcript_15463/g.34119 Transcript_15463/m.34119 type:complete len:190 (+) Transcript_15463:61-630(+)